MHEHPSKREHLVATASALFERDGFHATGIDRVLAAAGVAKMTLYKHFPSKEALIVACIERLAGRYEAALEAHLAQADPAPRAQLLATVGFYAAAAAQGSFLGCPFHHAAAEFGAHGSPVNEAARAPKRALHARLEGLARAAGVASPRAAAARLMVVLEGVLALGPLRVVEDLPAAAMGLALGALELSDP
ncbi:MAG: TetR/AcrR family transcriptional regulator [Planctomycetota bacterium]